MEDDGFRESTKIQLRDSVGAYCSAPYCEEQTNGYDPIRGKVLFSGDAAHIFGSKRKSARHDGLPSGWNRHGFENGIWLCAICHRHVDQTPGIFPGELLLKWKTEAGLRHINGYRRRNSIPYGTDMHEELRRAYAFLQLLEPAYNSFTDCLRRASTSPFSDYAITDAAASVLRSLIMPSIASHQWGNKHPCWTFIQDFQQWQNEIVRLAELLLKHSALRILGNRFINWQYSLDANGERVYAIDAAQEISLFVTQLLRFREFLTSYKGPGGASR